MVDSLTPEERSQIMARVRSKNSRPELAVRKIVFALGYRYRLHDAKLPGKPDLVFSKRRKVIFVHGCFWHNHSHARCKIARLPKSNPKYWADKLRRNVERDAVRRAELRRIGWKALVIWECQTKPLKRQLRRICCFLER